MKQKLIFITIYIYIYKGFFIIIQESLFLRRRQNLNLKLSKMLYYNILRCLFADV